MGGRRRLYYVYVYVCMYKLCVCVCIITNYREVVNLRWSWGDIRGPVGVEGGRVDMI